MQVSRNTLQSVLGLEGLNNPNYFATRAARNAAFDPATTEVGTLTAIGGDPESNDWDSPVWEVDTAIEGGNWALKTLDPNFALVVTDEGLLALTFAKNNPAEYKMAISAVKIKQSTVPENTDLTKWTASTFNNPLNDVILNTGNPNNATFTMENNVSHRTNLMNGGIQFAVKVDVDTLGQVIEGGSEGNGTILDYKIGTIGLFTRDESGKEVLLAVASLPNAIDKYASTPSRVGNSVKLYLNTTLTNMGTVANVNVIADSVNSIPEVVKETDLTTAYNGVTTPYNLYLVDNLYNTNLPALAVRTGNPVDNNIGWTFFTPTDDSVKIIENADTIISPNLQNYMVAAWNGSQYVPADGGVIANPNSVTNQQLAGLYINKTIVYAGEIKNTFTPYTYEYFLDNTRQGEGYKAGDILTYTKNGVTFDIRVVNTDLSGRVLQVSITPTTGKVDIGDTGFIYPTYKENLSTNKGLNFYIRIIAVSNSNDTYLWEFPKSWINKPVYADTGTNAGKLTTNQTEMFVGWCTSENSIKLALDLRNEATATTYGTTRYATNTEVNDVAHQTNAAEITSITPKTLQANYIQKKLVNGNPGDTAGNAIDVETHLSFQTAIIGKGINKSDIQNNKYNFAGNDKVSFWGVSYRALWADLAEYYRADKLYPAGTLVTIGDGNAEITEATMECNGIVSSKPGYVLGEKTDAFDLPVALVGKVPVLFAKDCVPHFGERIFLSRTEPGRASTLPYGKCLGKIIDKRENLEHTNSIMCVVRIAF